MTRFWSVVTASSSRITRPQRSAILAQMGEVLLDSEATNSGSLSAVPIPKLGIRSITPEEFVLDGDREIANPAPVTL